MRTVRSDGVRDAKFATKRPVVVHFVAGRVVPVNAREIAGTVSLVGALTTSERCAGGEGTEKIAHCVPTKRAFTHAVTQISAGGVGVLVLHPVRNVRLAQARCPSEPPAVRRAPLGPVPGSLRISSQLLANMRITRITLSRSITRTRTFASPEAGRLKEVAEWSLTLVRVPS